MQAGKVVVSDGSAASWDALPRDAAGTGRPVSARYVEQQLQLDSARAVTFPREVAPDDHEAIRKAVMGFLNDRPAPGRARAVVAQMSWGAVAEQLERIYLSLMPRELPPPGTEPATQHGQFGRQRQP